MRAVVREMVILEHFSHPQNCIKSTNKIPPYAREYKKEYLFIRGINKEFKYFIDKLDDLNDGLFESHRADRIKYFMKRFLRGQEKGKLKDISEFCITYNDIDNLIFINNKFRMYKMRYDYFKDDDDNDYFYQDDSDDEMMKMLLMVKMFILVLKIFMTSSNYFIVR